MAKAPSNSVRKPKVVTSSQPTIKRDVERRYLNPKLTLSYELIQHVCEMVLEGTSIKDAFLILGIPTSTFSNWFKRAQTEIRNREQSLYDTANDIFLELYYQVYQSVKLFEYKLQKKILKDTDWKSAAWLLERANKDKYYLSGKTTVREEAIEEDDSVVQVIITDMTDKERLEEMERELGKTHEAGSI